MADRLPSNFTTTTTVEDTDLFPFIRPADTPPEKKITGANLTTALGGGGGGATDHGALTGLADDDHSIYALADGTRGTFEVAGAVAAHAAAADPHPTYLTGAEGDAAYDPIGSGAAAQGAAEATAAAALAAHAANANAHHTPPAGAGLTVVEIDDTDSPYTASAGELVVADSTAGAVTVTLPAASAGALVYVKRISAGSDVTVDGDGAETIDGAASVDLTVQYEAVTLGSTSTEWLIL